MNEVPTMSNGASKSKWFFFWATLFSFGIIVAGIASFKYWLSIPPKFLAQADEGFKKAQKTIDPEMLRVWALENIHKNASRKEIASSMPEYLRTLYDEPPEDAWVDGSSMNLIWGGGFFHWGFYIGDTNETMPFVSNNSEYPYNFEWKSGIYYTREAKWKLQ
jgi:hypothetical protein